MKETKMSVSAIVGLVLAIIALLLSAIPIINNFAFVLAILGLIFGVMGLLKIKKGKRSGNKVAISSIIISVLAFGIVLASQAFYGAALDEVSKGVDEAVEEATADKTDEILANNINVELGKFTAKEDEYGFATTKLPVSVTSKLSESKSFNIQIEAVDKNGKRIADDYVSVNGLGAKQSQDFKVFEYVEEGKLNAMKKAEFKIVKVDQY